jgi:cytochrome c-type biogenesis protein CcmH
MSFFSTKPFKKYTRWGILAMVAFSAALLSSAFLSQAVRAQAPTPSDNDVNRVAGQLYCPVCENIPLDVCPTQACAQWRELIREKLAAGWSDNQIKQYFAAQYGNRVLSEPPRQGLNWLVYVVPPLIFLGGAVLLYFVIRRMRKRADAVSEAKARDRAPQTEDPYVLRLEEELKKRI